MAPSNPVYLVLHNFPQLRQIELFIISQIIPYFPTQMFSFLHVWPHSTLSKSQLKHPPLPLQNFPDGSSWWLQPEACFPSFEFVFNFVCICLTSSALSLHFSFFSWLSYMDDSTSYFFRADCNLWGSITVWSTFRNLMVLKGLILREWTN